MTGDDLTPGSVEFIGDPPYDLPIAQRVSAHSAANTVVLHLWTTIQGAPKLVRIAVLKDQAPALAAEIQAAVAQRE